MAIGDWYYGIWHSEGKESPSATIWTSPQQPTFFSLASKNELIDHGSTPDMSVEEHYYSKEAYAKLTKAQKHGLKLKHEKRGAKKCKPKEKEHAKLPTFSEDGHLIGQKLFV